jgi:hypothetical protein
MTAYEYIRDYVNVKLKASLVHGVGVFALCDIKEGDELFRVWDGESGENTLTENELNSLEEGVKEHLLDMYGYKEINGHYSMFVILNTNCHWIFKTPLHWVNSCGWNEEPNVDKETLRTTRFIREGEEILAKYGKYDKFKRSRTI